MKLTTVEEVKEYCYKNYENGLDWVIECLEDYQIQEHIKKGDVVEWLKIGQEMANEDKAAAKWQAYGTTDDEEIAEMLGRNQNQPNEEVEDDYPTEYGEERYTPSVTRGDYSPSAPWNAPGMSEKDFI